MFPFEYEVMNASSKVSDLLHYISTKCHLEENEYTLRLQDAGYGFEMKPDDNMGQFNTSNRDCVHCEVAAHF